MEEANKAAAAGQSLPPPARDDSVKVTAKETEDPEMKKVE